MNQSYCYFWWRWQQWLRCVRARVCGSKSSHCRFDPRIMKGKTSLTLSTRIKPRSWFWSLEARDHYVALSTPHILFALEAYIKSFGSPCLHNSVEVAKPIHFEFTYLITGLLQYCQSFIPMLSTGNTYSPSSLRSPSILCLHRFLVSPRGHAWSNQLDSCNLCTR